MSWLDRLSNVIKGLAEEKLSALESNNPDAVFAAAVDAAGERIGELRDRLVQLLADQDRKGESEALTALIAQTREALDKTQRDLEALRTERTRALAQRELAAAQVAVADLKQGLSQHADIQAVGTVRSDIERTHEKAHEGWLDGEGRPVHARVAKLQQRSAEDRAREELARLKAARDAPAEE